MKIYVNDGVPAKDIPAKRKIVEATLVKTFKTTFLVRLSDGTVILRKKNRDLPEGEVL